LGLRGSSGGGGYSGPYKNRVDFLGSTNIEKVMGWRTTKKTFDYGNERTAKLAMANIRKTRSQSPKRLIISTRSSTKRKAPKPKFSNTTYNISGRSKKLSFGGKSKRIPIGGKGKGVSITGGSKKIKLF